MQVPQPNEGDSGKPIKLLDRVRNRMRVLHLSKRTEEAYVSWISRYVYFHRERRGEWVHPENLIGEDVTHFLTYLAVDRKVAASTQNQAFSSLLFLYTKVLGRELKVEAVRAKTPQRLPTVLSKEVCKTWGHDTFMCGLGFLYVDLGYFRHGLLAKLVTFLYFVSNSFPIIRNKRRQPPWPSFLQGDTF